MSQLLFPWAVHVLRRRTWRRNPVPVQIRPTPLNEFKTTRLIKKHFLPNSKFCTQRSEQPLDIATFFCVYCITTWEETKIQDLFKATSLWNLFSSVDMKVEITSNPPISTGAWISHKWGIPLAWIFSSIRHDCLTWRHFLADSEELLKCDLEALYTVVWSLQIGF